MDDHVTRIVSRDLPQEFFNFFRSTLQHLYMSVYGGLSGGPSRMTGTGVSNVDMFNLQCARKARRANGRHALVRACEKFGVPYDLRFLRCNGQGLVVAQLGELLILPEPFDYFEEKPSTAAYKRDLAASHFAIRQLEFDFGDGFRRSRIDCRNTMLVVAQHGMLGGMFDEKHTALSMLRLAVPNWSFDSWTWTANAISDELAYLLDWNSNRRNITVIQEDKVRAVLKKSAIEVPDKKR